MVPRLAHGGPESQGDPPEQTEGEDGLGGVSIKVRDPLGIVVLLTEERLLHIIYRHPSRAIIRTSYFISRRRKERRYRWFRRLI